METPSVVSNEGLDYVLRPAISRPAPFPSDTGAGPLYAAFPVAGMLLKKGSKFSNVLIFMGAWSTTKIPLLLFEASSMGWTFMLLRFAIDIPVIVLIAFITEKLLNQREIDKIYELAEKMDRQSA